MRKVVVCGIVLALVMLIRGAVFADWEVILLPGGPGSSLGAGVSADQQVGYIQVGPTNDNRATLWSGSAASPVNLNPAGSEYSEALGVFEGQQVGYVRMIGSGYDRASLWSGSADSWIDLTPAGVIDAHAFGTHNGQQVGQAVVDGNNHASLWTGTAASWVDLNPAGAVDSRATAVSDDQQVGYANLIGFGSDYHASLWSGNAASWVDLNPLGATSSQALGVSGGIQVGWAYQGGMGRASLWTGTASSWVDLNKFLPSSYVYARANAVWEENGEIWVVGDALNKSATRGEAVLWHYTPELRGTITLDNWAAHGVVSIPAIIKYRVSGGEVKSLDTILSVTSSGGKGTAPYHLSDLLSGVYDLLVKPSHWLAKIIVGVDVSSGSVDNANVTCKNGDINSDNVVNFSDYLWLQGQYKQPPGTPSADLNGDGAVNFSDYLILQVNYKKTGDAL